MLHQLSDRPVYCTLRSSWCNSPALCPYCFIGPTRSDTIWPFFFAGRRRKKTRSSATAKSTARPSCLVGVLYDIYRRQTTDQQLINHFYETGHETYRIPRNNAKYWPLRRSRSFKVTDFGINRKPIYDFLLVINSNLPPILHRFQVTADYMQNFR